MHVDYFRFPGGILRIRSDEGAIVAIEYCQSISMKDPDHLTDLAIGQLSEYFAGKRKEFTLPLSLKGTMFQKRVWQTLRKVPYGSTVSYKDLTIMAGNKRGFQATGQAVGANPCMIVIPCHRVINNDGSLGGYGGDRELKRYLLSLEGTYIR